LPTISSPALVVAGAGALAAAAIDLRTGRIPNVLTFGLAAAGLLMAGTGINGIPVGAALAGLVVGGLLMIPGHVLGATGAGDVKLLAAIGAVLGPGRVVYAFLLTALAGGVMAVVIAHRRGRLAATLSGTGRLVRAPAETRRDVLAPGAGNRFCYGPAIAAGSLLSMVFVM
jgi:prepilin peptidase CpaA